ncbi:DUF445 domain-containing protein [Deltaproteobacteria bacterium TL4]
MTRINTNLPEWMNKSFMTNLLSVGLIMVGFLLEEPLRQPVLFTGLFALSGAITNWIAIYMLFDKVPGLYGSGVVPAHFEDFKRGIHNLIMNQFFTRENVENFFSNTASTSKSISIDLSPIINAVDLSTAFDSLVSTIKESPFGGMLGMLGGEGALEPLKEPFFKKMKQFLVELSQSEPFQKNIRIQLGNSSATEDILNKVKNIVQRRLDELTPKMVKDIIQEMMRKHLGWLVVWGGVFGGLIGLVTAFIPW